MDTLEELYKNLEAVEEKSRISRSAWEKHMEKINWDIEKAAKENPELIDEMNSLWHQVELDNEQYNQAHKDIKNFITGDR